MAVFRGSEAFRQRLPGDAEVLRGERAVAVADLEHAPDVGELDLLERRDRSRWPPGPLRRPTAERAARSAPRATSSGGRWLDAKQLVVVQQHGAADDGAQLADVAGPAVGGEHAVGLGRDGREATAELARRSAPGSARPGRGCPRGRSRSGGRCTVMALSR